MLKQPCINRTVLAAASELSTHPPILATAMADAPVIFVVDSEGESEAESEGRHRGDYDIDGNLIMHPNEDLPDAHNEPLAPDDPDDDPREAGRTPADVLCTCANHKVRCVRA